MPKAHPTAARVCCLTACAAFALAAWKSLLSTATPEDKAGAEDPEVITALLSYHGASGEGGGGGGGGRAAAAGGGRWGARAHIRRG